MNALTLLARAAESHTPDPCLVCGALEHTTLYPSTYEGTAAEASAYFLAHRTATAHGRIVRCGQCGFAFTSPRFSNTDYDRIYGGIAVDDDLDPSFEAAKAARFRRLGAIVRRFQLNDGPVLDFGCGDGGFLRTFGRPEGRGFEVGAEGRRVAGPCEITTGHWASVAGTSIFPPESFDYVVAVVVRGHQPDLKRDGSLIRSVLKPDGLFFASVPDIASLVARAMGSRWNMILLEHLWYFSPDTYRRMMADLGFEMLHVRQVPFDAPLADIATRLAQTFGMKGAFRAGPLSRAVLPTPAGIMLGVFRKAP